jgi:hypothetical protein
LLKPQSKATTKVTDIRNQLLTDMGNTVGFRGVWQLELVNWLMALTHDRRH